MAEQLSNERQFEIRERAEAATPGPWRNEGNVVADENSIVVGDESYNWRFVAHVNSDTEEGADATHVISETEAVANAEFIANARADIPDLLAEVSRLTTELARVREENERLKDIEEQWDDAIKAGLILVEAAAKEGA